MFFRSKELDDLRKQAEEAVRAFRGLGQTFQYLGKTCVVTGHWGGQGDETWPCIQFEYFDESGVIHSHIIWPRMLPGVIEQQP